jgi:putative OPT family oligopeptide transporter
MPEVEIQQPAFRPFVSPDQKPPEFTFRALLIGCIFGIIFGAVTVYVGLRAGLTVAASIPISVLSISILRVLGRASILENNIVQTTGNAGQSIASGVIFTLPALVFLGFELEYARIFMLALIGGWLGVLFMIPLRRQLIVKEHGALPYPEGTACADVLIAGERGGSLASRVFLGLGLGGVYTFLANKNLLAVWPGSPGYSPDFGPQHVLKGSAINADATSEYLGVGYIIGTRVAGVIFAGGVFSWLVVMPLIYFFGKALPGPIYPGQVPIAQMGPSDLWAAYIKPMGAGAVAAAGLITLLKTIPTIWAALTEGLKSMRGGAATVERAKPIRTENDLSMTVVLIGSLLIVACMFIFLEFKPVPGAFVGWAANLAAALLVVVFGFLFVTVSSRIVGLVGSSASPVSGMTIATLMATAAVFLVQGWTAPAFGALAITIGGVVCIAASNSGDTSQDLKTGYIIGATPRLQQIALMIGVVVSTLIIGVTLNLMNTGLQEFHAMDKAWDINAPHAGVAVQPDNHPPTEIRVVSPDGKSSANQATAGLVVLNSIGSTELQDGKYLYSPASGKIEVQWIQGIGSPSAPAPQARLMATVINGILSRKLPWGIVLLGVCLVIAVELLGIRSLTFAVGAYLPIGTTLPIFCGGVVRFLVDRAAKRAGETDADSEISSGSLFASGLIAAGGIAGLIGVALKALEATYYQNRDLLNVPHTFLDNDLVSVLAFAALAYSLYHFARKPVTK